MLVRFSALLLALMLLAGAAFAATPEEIITGKLKAAFPDVVIANIKPAGLPGFYLVTSSNYDPIFVSADGHYMIQGDVMELRGTTPVNVYDQAMITQRKDALAAVDRHNLIIFPAAGGKARASVYVFTDVDCPYCRKLHAQVAQMNKLGIEVRYLAFPRAGIKSAAAGKMDKVWCAQDRNSAMADAKMGKVDPGPQRSSCKSPVPEQYALGVSLGVHGTPSVILEDGTEVGGYITATELGKTLELK
jgi:thiol:disulfide interchange protein DsbC